MKDPTREEMYSFLEQACAGSEDIRFDIEEAIYWFANDYHNGQASDLYAALCQSEYKPGALTRGPEDRMMYDMLVAEYGD